MGDVGIGLAASWLLWIFFAPAVIAVTNADTDNLSLGTIALLQIPFDGGMLAVAMYASIAKGNGPIVDFGFVVKLRDLAGLLAGLFTQYAALLVYLPFIWFGLTSADDISKPARELTSKAHTATEVILLVVIVVIVAPIVEELFFRGLVMRALERRYDRRWAVLGSSAIFAAAHVEPLQFPALFIFGLVAAALTMRTGRLGPGMAAHVAFNAVAVITLLS
jgi:membrane protease YdiL (CAAX protease family)